jgi:hypothetical protein
LHFGNNDVALFMNRVAKEELNQLCRQDGERRIVSKKASGKIDR